MRVIWQMALGAANVLGTMRLLWLKVNLLILSVVGPQTLHVALLRESIISCILKTMKKTKFKTVKSVLLK